MVGKFAVKHAVKNGENGSVAIRRLKNKPYQSACFITPLHSVAREATHMKDAFVNAAGNDVTKAWLAYVRPLVGKLPKMGLL